MFRLSDSILDLSVPAKSGLLRQPEHLLLSQPSGNAFDIERPKYQIISVKTALEFHWNGYHVSEKMDGCWHEMRIGSSVIVGEMMADGTFCAFNLLVFNGKDIRKLPTSERLELLASHFPNLQRPAEPIEGESAADFLNRVLARGGEGIVAVALNCPFGVKTFKVKRNETFDCVVTEKHHQKKSLHLSLNGEDVGWCACRARGELRKISVGSVVEVSCMKRFSSGRFREPVFIRPRPDKSF